MNNCVILFGGGTGSRFKSNIPKQFAKIDGKSIFYHTFLKFKKSNRVDKILCVCIESYIGDLRDEIENEDKLLDIIPGSTDAMSSILNGIDYLNNIKFSGNVIIHDAIRPIISYDDIESNIDIAEKYGNCIEYIDFYETIMFKETILRREDCKILRAPQTFKLEEITRCFELMKNQYKSCRDCAELAIKCGVSLHYHRCDTKNIKVTYPEDFNIATEYLK